MSRLCQIAIAVTFLLSSFNSSASSWTPHETRAVEIFKQLVEINTTQSVGDNTEAAEAMAERLLQAGFPPEDVKIVVPAPRKGNLVARYRSAAPTKKPILFPT